MVPIERIAGAARETPTDGPVQRLIIRVDGRQLHEDQAFPPIVGKLVNQGGGEFHFGRAGIKVISVLNGLDTEICDMQTSEMEELQRRHPEIDVVTVTKQTPEELEEILKTKPEITHKVVSIDDKAAETIGVALEPDEGAPEFWNNMLQRSVFVTQTTNEIVYREYVDEQMEALRYRGDENDPGVFDVVEALLVGRRI